MDHHFCSDCYMLSRCERCVQICTYVKVICIAASYITTYIYKIVLARPSYVLVSSLYIFVHVGKTHILTVNLGTNKSVDVTIPCGGKDPPYTYINSGLTIIAESVNEYYTAVNQRQSNNGDGYCCISMGGTTCYKLNITCTLCYS